MDRILLCIFLFVTAASAHAGSGLYYSLDAMSHTMHTETQTDITYSTSSPAPTSESGTSEKKYAHIGLDMGYKYKRRMTHHFFMTPELHVSNFDSNTLIYGTNLKLGTEYARFGVYGIVGVSHIDMLKKNTTMKIDCSAYFFREAIIGISSVGENNLNCLTSYIP